jgi:hypothetical protein
MKPGTTLAGFAVGLAVISAAAVGVGAFTA